MIISYFFKIYPISLVKIVILTNYIIIHIKIPKPTPKFYYKFLFYKMYKVWPKSVNTKNYSRYYKILVLKYNI